MKAAQPFTELDKRDNRHIHFSPLRASPKAREFERQEINRMLSMDVIDLEQRSCPTNCLCLQKGQNYWLFHRLLEVERSEDPVFVPDTMHGRVH